MFTDHLFIRRDVDAVDLVVGDETFKPLDLWTKLLENAQDFCEMAWSSCCVNLPALGTSRSMTYFGMVRS
ncbi:MAG: hypothetical protein WA383_21345 [Terriglobales bacterium]